MGSIETRHLTTQLAIEAVKYERAPRHDGGRVNRRIVCADGFKVSVQASAWHYANDSDPSGKPPYWRSVGNPSNDPGIFYPFTAFEVGNPTTEPTDRAWQDYESGGVWAWVPPRLVAELLDEHGGAIAWEEGK